jgi:ferric-dicitrate binding protein FerR (iron transport regulator)
MIDRNGHASEPNEARVAERIRNLSPPQADPSFRERLKHEFVSGSFADRPRVVPIPPRRTRRRLRWAFGIAAAAACVTVVAALNQPPRWTALPSAGTGHLVVNGTPVPIHETAELTRRLEPGARVRLECTADLDLVSSGLIAMQLSPGTELVLPSPPGRWFGRSANASVARGLLRVTTGRRFSGARLAITTPEAMIRVTGTTLAVIAEPAGTCVCVLEGAALVRPHRGETTRISSGSRCEVPRGAHRSAMGEMRGTERPKLLDLRDRMRAVMN